MSGDQFKTKDSGERVQWSTGMQRDTTKGKPLWSLLIPLLIPFRETMLYRWVMLLTRGAEKYSRPIPVTPEGLVEVCSCDGRLAIRESLSTLGAFVESVTNVIFGSEIKSSPNAKGQTLVGGGRNTRSEGRPLTSLTDVLTEIERRYGRSSSDGPLVDWLLSTAKNYLTGPAGSALFVETRSVPGGQTSTTITRQDWLVAFYAHVVTKAWASSEIRSWLFGEHSSTCPTRRLQSTSTGLVLTNDRNWEKAETQEELDRFHDSAFRHFMQWLAGETDEDHAAAVFFNINGAEYVKSRMAGKGETPTWSTTRPTVPEKYRPLAWSTTRPTVPEKYRPLGEDEKALLQEGRVCSCGSSGCPGTVFDALVNRVRMPLPVAPLLPPETPKVVMILEDDDDENSPRNRRS